MSKIYKILLVSMLYYINIANIFADDLKKASSIAAYGTKFQSARLKIAAENIANEDSTGTSPGADAYKRKIIFAENKYNKKIDTNVITIKKIDVDNSDFIMKYDPYHPAANQEGYVKYPNITREIERADAAEAQRSFEANLSVMEVTGMLMQKTIEAIGR